MPSHFIAPQKQMTGMFGHPVAENPIDQMLNVAFIKNNPEDKYILKKDFILQQYDFRNKNRQQVIEQIKNMFRPVLHFD